MMQTKFSPRNISANKVERVVPNTLQDFHCGPSVLRASRSPFHCIDPAQAAIIGYFATGIFKREGRNRGSRRAWVRASKSAAKASNLASVQAPP